MLTLAFDPSRKKYASNIKILNLSKNRFGKHGAKEIFKIFESNKQLEAFDLSFNKIGCSGA